MSVVFNAPAVAMSLDLTSIQDFALADPDQLFYGLLDVRDGRLFLVAGWPNIGLKAFHRGAVNGTAQMWGGYDDGQGGHIFATQRCQIPPPDIHNDHIAGFGLKKGQQSPGTVTTGLIHNRSGFNRETFTGRNLVGNHPDGRKMPMQWSIAVKNACDGALGNNFQWDGPI